MNIIMLENTSIKENVAWKITRIHNKDRWVVQLDVETNKGYRRWWYTYTVHKTWKVLGGILEITSFEDDKDIKRTYNAGKEFDIPAHTPHIFYSSTATRFVEVFDEVYEKKEFSRYYEKKQHTSK